MPLPSPFSALLTRRGLAAAAAAAFGATAGAPAPAAELTLDSASGFTVPALVNGIILRLRVDPAASGIVLLNPAAARRSGLGPEALKPMFMYPGRTFRRAFARIGPVTLTGKAATRVVVIGGRPMELKLGWFDADVLEGVDGVVSAAHLPYDKIVFRLGGRAGGRDHVVPLRYQLNLGLYHPYPAGERTIPVQFSLWKETSLATASAGARLAAVLGGRWAGAQARAPVAFGVPRPVRPLTLARPMSISGLAVERFLVRVGDHPGDVELPADAPQDPDEIVVTGSRAKPQAERLNLTLGRLQFAGCSEIVFEPSTQLLTLRCAPATEEKA